MGGMPQRSAPMGASLPKKTKKEQRVLKKEARKAQKLEKGSRKRSFAAAEDEALASDAAGPASSDDEDGENNDVEKAAKRPRRTEEHIFHLPIKVNGQLRIHKREQEADSSEDEQGADAEASAAAQQKAALEAKKAAAEQEAIDHAKSDENACMKIGHLSSIIVEDPENHLGKLHTLRQYMSGATVSTTVKKVAILSQMAVFKDVLPGYRIKTTSPNEEGKLSKDVAQLRAHEATLLTQYQHFLQAIDKLLYDPKAVPSLKAVATQALCGLLESAPYFNFRLNICKALVHQAFVLNDTLSARREEEREEQDDEEESATARQVRQIAETFSALFRQDELGEASHESVTLIAAEIKRKGYKAPVKLLKAFEDLRLDASIIQPAASDKKQQANAKKKKVFMTKKAKKLSKEQKVVDEEMREAEAIIRQEDRAKFVTETAKLVFSTYFRVLKNAPRSPLLPCVLEGLSHFGHLLSVEYFEDLLSTLKDVMRHPDMEPKNALRCVILAINLLSGQGEALTIDAKDFYVQLYALLYTLPALQGDQKALCLLLLQALQTGFDERKTSSAGTPPARMPSFMTRLSHICMHLSPEYSLTFLSHLSARWTTNSSLRDAMLLTSPVDTPPASAMSLAEQDDDATGVLEDPDTITQLHASQSWWQGAIMDYAYHPVVRELCNVMCGSDGQAGSANHIFTQDVKTEQDVADYFSFWQKEDLMFRPAPKKPKMRLTSKTTTTVL